MADKSGYNPLSLDALNFLLADVRGAVGPYLNVYLVTVQHWTQTQMGLAAAISGVIGLLFQTPIGAAIDLTTHKRTSVAVSVALLGISGLVIYFFPAYYPVVTATTLMAIVGDVFGPAIGAITLGIHERSELPRRLGRNSVFDHAGNIFIALLAAGIGFCFGQKSVFLLVPLGAVLTIATVYTIPKNAIDNTRAAGRELEADEEPGAENEQSKPISFNSDFIKRWRLLAIFALCIMLFHFANAPLLVLVGQKLAFKHPKFATSMMSACIIGAQAVMLPIAALAGAKGSDWGRKKFLLVAFMILPLRAFLYVLSDHSAWLLAIQLLDGVGAGILGVVVPLVVADISKGTGRFNLAQGVVATVQGLGVSLSTYATGCIVDRWGFSAGFEMLGAVAIIGFIVLLLTMPETKQLS